MCTYCYFKKILSHLRYKIKKHLGLFYFICSNINVIKIPGIALYIKSYYLESIMRHVILVKNFSFSYICIVPIPTALYILVKSLPLSLLFLVSILGRKLPVC
jgi:hypothetical protein